jgi:hypothetical protein
MGSMSRILRNGTTTTISHGKPKQAERPRMKERRLMGIRSERLKG